MNLGERLLNLRKKEHLSQEEVAFKLNVSRQTISKWETDQSTPDFDKIAPLCELYGITADELLTGKKEEIKEEKLSSNKEEIAKKVINIPLAKEFIFKMPQADINKPGKLFVIPEQLEKMAVKKSIDFKSITKDIKIPDELSKFIEKFKGAAKETPKN